MVGSSSTNSACTGSTPFLIIIILQGPNKGEHQIRYYGWYSNKNRGMAEKAKKPGVTTLPGMPEPGKGADFYFTLGEKETLQPPIAP